MCTGNQSLALHSNWRKCILRYSSQIIPRLSKIRRKYFFNRKWKRDRSRLRWYYILQYHKNGNSLVACTVVFAFSRALSSEVAGVYEILPRQRQFICIKYYWQISLLDRLSLSWCPSLFYTPSFSTTKRMKKFLSEGSKSCSIDKYRKFIFVFHFRPHRWAFNSLIKCHRSREFATHNKKKRQSPER